MATVVKAIKPARLKVDAFRLAMLNHMRLFGTEMKREYEKTVATWSRKPKFVTLVSLQGARFTVVVDTDSVIYGYVDQGTGEAAGHGGKYLIMAGIYTGKSTKKALAFRGSYTAKTVPGVIGSRGGGGSGDKVVRPYVLHPGIKPRGFTPAIEKLMAPRFKRHMQQGMREFAKASGHYMKG